jgi:DNA-binding SARP family transcriptional activator
MIYLHTLGGASIEIESTRRCADAEGGGDGEADDCASPRVAERARLTSSAPRRFALLLYLAVERGRRVGRERLQALIFPEQSPTKARHSLREVIYQLRAAGASILTDHDDVFVPADQVWCDAWAAIEQDPLSEETVHAIAGGLLTGYAPEHSEAYSEWYEAHLATSISSLARRLLVATNVATNEAQWGFAERAARACLAIDPLNEGATLALAGILAVNGSKASAIDLVDRYVAEIGSQSADLKFPAMALKRRISEGLPSRHLVQRPVHGDSGDSAFITPAMVGRARELAELQEGFGLVRAGASQCLVVAGEAGIGKTRLVAEFSATAVLQGARVERVTIQPHDGERPMGAFVDLVPALLRARGALGCSPASMDALRNLIGRQPQGDLPQQAAGAEEHEQRWAAVSRAVVDLCEAIASEGALVLVIEDAHWLDTLSANTIGRIIGAGRESRILVVATTRDPRPLVRDMRLAERCRTVTLGPLDDVATKELLDVLLPPPSKPTSEKGVGDGGASVRAQITEVSAGNPLFLISLAAHSRAHPGEFKIPGTIVETFAQRIDALSRRALSVLATCAELGKHSTLNRLVRSLEMRKHELVESLLELTESGLILRDEQNAVPAHPLVSEALRNRLPQPVRRAVAHSVAATLEADADGGASPSPWWDAAQSWRSADNPERAIHALRRCAKHALEIGRPGEAARLLSEAAELPQSPDSLRGLTESLILAADAANESTLVVSAVAKIQSRVDDQHDDVEIATIRAHFNAYRSDDRMADRLPRCIRSPSATPAHRIEASILLLKCADMAGRNDLRDIAIRETRAEDLGIVGPPMQLEFQILAASCRGDRSRAASVGRELMNHCQEMDLNGVAPLKYHHTAVIALYLGGRVEEAIEGFKWQYGVGCKRGSFRTQQRAATHLSALHFDSARDDEAHRWLGLAVGVGEAHPELANDFDLATLRIEYALVERKFDLAQRLLDDITREGLPRNDVCQRWVRGARLAIKSGRHELDAEARIIARQIGQDRMLSMTGARDFEIAIAVEALLALGERRDASSILDQYLVERDDLRPPTRLLSRAIQGVMTQNAERDSPADAAVTASLLAQGEN